MPTKPKSKSNEAVSGKRFVNTYISKPVAEAFAAYCKRNRKLGSVSAALEEHMIKTILAKGKKYGLRLPAEFYTA